MTTTRAAAILIGIALVLIFAAIGVSITFLLIQRGLA
jgi:hypothetical protein